MKHYLFLAAAILFEVIGSSFLKKTEQFTKPIPSILFVCSLGLSFYLLSYALRGVPMGIAYAIWSAFGIVIISAVGYFVYKESLDLPAILGIVFIIVGVVIINLFSKSSAH
ncbi:DMT family transporter [Sphingobacterium tabacisoli]|uniref:DMT family transporter n=1 Tax=Sphingobacterium tabacisoli TaxID=2044855 RepID=A0ABW5L6F9_9SPHI|nr:multidrug efflux SMR transporter [Sphingobacterium tabacisoli]